MTTQLQTVLDALEYSKHSELTWAKIDEAISIVRGMMEAEPVAWVCTKRIKPALDPAVFDEPFYATNYKYVEAHKHHDWKPLYTHPAPQAVPAVEPVGEVTEVGVGGFHVEFSKMLKVGDKIYAAAPAVEDGV